MATPPDAATDHRPARSRDEVLARIRAVRGELDALGVRSVRLFGSAARDELGPESDVDVLVESEETPSLVPFMATLELLERAVGRRVDMACQVPSSRCWPSASPGISSMQREAQLYLGDLLDMCRCIRDYPVGLDAVSLP